MDCWPYEAPESQSERAARTDNERNLDAGLKSKCRTWRYVVTLRWGNAKESRSRASKNAVRGNHAVEARENVRRGPEKIECWRADS